MSNTTDLTPEQEARIPEYREKWIKIGLATGPGDRKVVEEAIHQIYKAAGISPPKIIVWLRSPREGEAIANIVSEKGKPAECLFGSQEAGWLSFYDYFGEVVGLDCCKALKPFMTIAENAGWWWPFEELAIVTERPETILVDEAGELHCETGPAVEYSDGFRVWAWHGFTVDKRVIEKEVTLEDIQKEENVEIRRILTERYGEQKYLLDSGAEVIDMDSDEHNGTRALMQMDQRRWLVVADPSTGRTYSMEVPSNTNSCISANEYLSGNLAGTQLGRT